MTAYLSHLAARSLSADEAVRPRVASLFEPAGPINDAAEAWLVRAVELPAPPGREEPSAHVPSAPAHAPVPAHEPAPTPRRREAAGEAWLEGPASSRPHLPRAAERSVAVLPPPGVPSAPAHAPVPASSPPAPTPARREETSRARSVDSGRHVNPAEPSSAARDADDRHRAPEGPVQRREVVTIKPSAPAPWQPRRSARVPTSDHPPLSKPVDEPEARPTQAGPPLRAALDASTGPVVVRARPDLPGAPASSRPVPQMSEDAAAFPAPRLVAADLPLVVPPQTPPLDRLAPVPLRREPPPPPTIVQVTIGRIEVRATPAPVEQGRRERETRAVMSLDEYLRARETGR